MLSSDEGGQTYSSIGCEEFRDELRQRQGGGRGAECVRRESMCVSVAKLHRTSSKQSEEPLRASACAVPRLKQVMAAYRGMSELERLRVLLGAAFDTCDNTECEAAWRERVTPHLSEQRGTPREPGSACSANVSFGSAAQRTNEFHSARAARSTNQVRSTHFIALPRTAHSRTE